MVYKFLRSILFWFDAEKVHHVVMESLRVLCKIGLIRMLIRFVFKPRKANQQQLMGLEFRNPVGLAAGFDKNAQYLQVLEALGFGHVEIGTVTPLPQEGNPLPRLFRLPKDEALVNRMGFNNEGVKLVAERARKWRNQEIARQNRFWKIAPPPRMLVGGNIGKNKLTPNEDAWKDYEICFNELFDAVDYFVVNVSSPNTPGLRELQEKSALKKILSHLIALNEQKEDPKPILLKIAPDLEDDQVRDVADLALELKLSGLVVANTTVSRENLKTTPEELKVIGAGGVSGKPVANRTIEVLRVILVKTDGFLPVIASGGIFTAKDAFVRFGMGANLVQVWTGFVYEGPFIAKKMCEELADMKILFPQPPEPVEEF